MTMNQAVERLPPQLRRYTLWAHKGCPSHAVFAMETEHDKHSLSLTLPMLDHLAKEFQKAAKVLRTASKKPRNVGQLDRRLS